MSRIRIGVMGCASIAKRSMLPAIKAMPDLFELVAVSSRSKAKADSFALEFRCTAVVGYDKLLKQDIDAVYIPLPTGLHDEWINNALLAGKHVYAEKAIAFSYESAKKMVNNAMSKKLALMEGFMFQYHTQHDIVKKIISEGRIGEIRSFRSSFGFPPLEKNNFRYNKEIGGGVVFDAACYPIRSVYFLLGSKFEVIASSLFFDKTVGSHTYGSAFLKGENGLSAHVAFGFDNFYQCDYEIWGSKGKITATRAFTPKENFSPEIILEIEGERTVILADKCNHFINAMVTFHQAINHDKEKSKHYEDILVQSKSLDKIIELYK